MLSIRILIADDHTAVRRGLRQMCMAEEGFDVVGEAQNGQEAIELAGRLKPNVILMDNKMPPGIDGVEATRSIIKEHRDQIRVIILTAFEEDKPIYEAFRAGACGYLLKQINDEYLFYAIRAVYYDNALIYPAKTLRILNAISRRNSLGAADHALVESLTEGEKDVLLLVAQGLDNSEISRQLHLAESTIANRLRDIYQKTYVQNRTQATLWALRNGLATLD